MDDLERAVQHSGFIRYLGVLCLGLGSFLAYLTIYPPIADAMAGTRVISIHRTGVGGAFGALLCGVNFLIAGKHVGRFMVLKWRTATPLQVCGTLSLAAACFAFQRWFESYFAGLGFVIQRLQ
jgi:hypothetical protein